MIIAVIGGLGFQGVHLTKALLDKGHVVYVFNTPSEHAMQNLTWLRKNANTSYLTLTWGSITDTSIFERLIPQVDVVFHLAAKINVDESIQDPLNFINTNVYGTFNVLEYCRKKNTRLIMASTVEVYGGGTDIDESSPLMPKSPYAASKAAADRLAYAYAQTYGMQVDIVRPENVYGPNQKSGKYGGVISIFLNNMIQKRPLKIYGDGTQERDYIYVEDVVKMYMKILENPSNECRVFTFGSGKAISVKDIAFAVSELSQYTEIIFVDGRPGEVKTFTAKKKPSDYFPDVELTPFEEGLKRTYEYCLRQ